VLTGPRRDIGERAQPKALRISACGFPWLFHVQERHASLAFLEYDVSQATPCQPNKALRKSFQDENFLKSVATKKFCSHLHLQSARLNALVESVCPGKETIATAKRQSAQLSAEQTPYSSS